MFKKGDDGVIIAIKVIPKSSKSEIVTIESNELKIKIAAVADKGLGNDELIRFLSKKLRIAKSSIMIISGETSRHKRLLLKGIKIEDLKSLLF